MSDLGLAILTDDQLLELLTEACQELGQRDPVVRDLAQKQIYAEAERVKAYKGAIKKAVIAARKEYEESIRKETREWVDGLVTSGEWSPLGSNEETKVLVEEGKRRREEVIAQARKTLKQPMPAENKLWLNITSTSIAASYTYRGQGRQTTQANQLDHKKVDRFIAELEKCLEMRHF